MVSGLYNNNKNEFFVLRSATSVFIQRLGTRLENLIANETNRPHVCVGESRQMSRPDLTNVVRFCGGNWSI